MSEHKTSLEVIAPTVEEAIERGAAELGLPKEQLEVEILDEGGKGFLGLSARQARVRLSVAIEPDARRPAPADGPAERALAEQREPAERPSEQRGPIERRRKEARRAEREPLAEGDQQDEEALRVAREIVLELIQRMGLDVDVDSRWVPKDPEARIQPLMVDVRGHDLGILIGRGGETLSALQYIARLIVAKELQRHVAIVIDVEGYRARREEQLTRLAHQMAEQAIELHRTMELEPMPANERRIIHVALRDVAAVTTESIGEGARRKVTIIPQD